MTPPFACATASSVLSPLARRPQNHFRNAAQHLELMRLGMDAQSASRAALPSPVAPRRNPCGKVIFTDVEEQLKARAAPVRRYDTSATSRHRRSTPKTGERCGAATPATLAPR